MFKPTYHTYSATSSLSELLRYHPHVQYTINRYRHPLVAAAVFRSITRAEKMLHCYIVELRSFSHFEAKQNLQNLHCSYIVSYIVSCVFWLCSPQWYVGQQQVVWTGGRTAGKTLVCLSSGLYFISSFITSCLSISLPILPRIYLRLPFWELLSPLSLLSIHLVLFFF